MAHLADLRVSLHSRISWSGFAGSLYSMAGLSGSFLIEISCISLLPKYRGRNNYHSKLDSLFLLSRGLPTEQYSLYVVKVFYRDCFTIGKHIGYGSVISPIK